MRLKSVLFPAPLGPMRACLSPFRIVEVDAVDDPEMAKILGNAFERRECRSNPSPSVEEQHFLHGAALDHPRDPLWIEQKEHDKETSHEELPSFREGAEVFDEVHVDERADDRARAKLAYPPMTDMMSTSKDMDMSRKWGETIFFMQNEEGSRQDRRSVLRR